MVTICYYMGGRRPEGGGRRTGLQSSRWWRFTGWASRSRFSRYILRGLPPGEYRIAVVDSIEAGQQFDPGFLAQIEADALPVRVTAGDSTKAELRIR
jgi:hypothetical protein